MIKAEVLLARLIQLVLDRDIVEEVLPLVTAVSPTLHLPPDDDTNTIVVKAATEAIRIIRTSSFPRGAIIVVHADAEVCTL